jgi:hypothetical protein
MKRKTAESQTTELATKILRYLTERTLGKAHYEHADELLKEIMKVAPLDKAIPLNDTESAEVVDLFKESLKVFRAHGISRYEIKVKKTVKCKDETPPAKAKVTEGPVVAQGT